ncbi:MAG: hypothetical protein ACE5MM_04845 [Nitrospiraceae bacterium]
MEHSQPSQVWYRVPAGLKPVDGQVEVFERWVKPEVAVEEIRFSIWGSAEPIVCSGQSGHRPSQLAENRKR